VDGGVEAGDEAVMKNGSRSDGAHLWAEAQALARSAQAVRGGERSRVPPLLFFTDPERTPHPWEVASRMPPGSGVVYRGFGRPEALDEAHRLRTVTQEQGMALLIGEHAELADAVGADGLHLPERALMAAASLAAWRPGWILTGAVHSVAAARAARDLDAAILSPIFPAGGTSAARPTLGLDALSAAASGAVPVFALGGISARTAGRLAGTGCGGLAGVSGIASAFDA